MIPKSHEMLDPTTIQDINGFEWITRILSKGFMHGKHASGRLGQGMEFQQFRNYLPGDDIRSVDWKMYARTEKLYIKQSNIETEHAFHFILDNSKSMLYEESGWSKLMLGKVLIAAMMKIVSNQGDRFSWQAADFKMPKGSGIKHWHQSIETLYVHNTSDLQPKIIHGLHKNETIIWISDFYGEIDEIKKLLQMLKNPTTTVVLFQILGEQEKALSFSRNTTFKDLESGEKLNVNASSIQSSYRQKLTRHIEELKSICHPLGIQYEECSMNRSVVESLRKFFNVYRQSQA